MANHTLGTIRGTIEIDYDGAGIVRAVRDTEKAKKEFGSIDGASSKVLSAFGKFAGGALKVAGGINLVTNGIHALVGVIATVGPLAAAAFATAPALILSFASALVISKIALAGVGDALKAAGGDAKKFDEAIKDLSPQAQKFAKAFRAAVPQLNAVKKSIQDAFFKGTAGQVGGVVKRISSLSGVASQVSRAMGLIVQNIVKFGTSTKSINGLKVVLGGVRDFLNQIKSAVGPVLAAFIGLGAQGGSLGKIVGGQVAAAFAKLAEFIGKIDLKSLFAAALPILQQLGGFFVDIGTIVSKVFGIFVSDGGDAVGTLTELTFQLAEFLRSAQGAAVLDSLQAAMTAISGAVGQIFLALLQALAPAIIALAPGVTTLAGQISGLLVPAINALAPLLQSLATFLSENMGWIGPLAGAVVALAGAYKVYVAAAKAVAAVQGIIQSKLVVATGAWIANTAAVVASRVAAAATAAVQAGAVVAAWIASTAAVVANRVATLAAQAAMLIVRTASLAWAAAQWLLNAALSANPIGLVVLAIAALVAGLIYAYKHSETFRNIVNAVWAAIKVAIKATVDWITNVAWPAIVAAWNAIITATANLINWIRNAWNNIKNFLAAVWNGIKAVASAVWSAIVSSIRTYINIYKAIITAGINAVKAVWNAILNTIKAVARAVWSAIVSDIKSKIAIVKSVIAGIKVVVGYIRNAFTSAKSAAANVINGLISLVRSIPGRVTGALGNLAGLLYSKGQAIIQGFISGIKSMIGRVSSAAHSVVSAVTDFLPGSPAKTGPLSGQGYVLLRAQRFMEDFAKGIAESSQLPVGALLGSINPLARAVTTPTVVNKGGPNSTATITGPPSNISGVREYNLNLDGKVLATFVVDTITGNPVAVKKASDRGSQTTAWAGSGRN